MGIHQRLSLLLGVLVVAATIPAAESLPSTSPPLPTPEEAARQAERLSPEELTQLEMDEVTRDRLRSDPNWQLMLQAIRRDIMVIKWGNGKLENPVWKQYGAKAYPLLDYYARSGDPTRQKYAIVGIRSLGKPYSTLWLRRQLQRSLSNPNFYDLTSDPKSLLSPEYDPNYDSKSWERDFGLDDPRTRAELIQLAKQHLEPENSPTFYDQFNLSFLIHLLGYDKVIPSRPSPYDPKPAPNLSAWNKFERLTQPTPSDLQAAIAYYRKLSPDAQEYLLVNRLGHFKAGTVPPMGRALLRHLAVQQGDPNRVLAIADLDRHNDSQGVALMKKLLAGEMSELYSLTRSASYEDFSDRGTHAYYLLLNIVQKYPQSRFVQACKEYGDLTGKSYFGGEPRSKTIVDRNARKTAVERTRDWQQWLGRYSDHPGADDAVYFLARSLQDQNKSLEAMNLWLGMMLYPKGDRDASYLAWGHVRTMLDVGLTTEELETLIQQPELETAAPLLRYALAVHYARSQNYARALELSEQLDLTAMSPAFLGTYYGGARWAWWTDISPDKLQQRMQAMLKEQRQRWQQLQGWQQENTPEARYQIASHWAGAGGWKNGYLPIWENFRIFFLPTGDWSDYFCQIYWSCNTRIRKNEVVQNSYQQASQNGVALELYDRLLSDPRTPNALREKTLYMTAMTLLHQWENYPWGETVRIHPPGGVTTRNQPITTGADLDYQDWERMNRRLEQDYQRRIDSILTELQVKFPRSAYIDDLLFSSYYLSGQRNYLEQLVKRYPQSDRATEARFLLELAPESPPRV